MTNEELKEAIEMIKQLNDEQLHILIDFLKS